MPLKPRTATVLARIAAIIFALTAIISLFAAYEAHQEGERLIKVISYLARTVIFTTLCIVFISRGARIKRTALGNEAAAKDNNVPQ